VSDLPTILLTLSIPGIIGLLGVWLGTRMTQRGAVKLAKQTLDGQRTLANDAALREWRRQQVAPYLDAASQRVHYWMELLRETSGYEGLNPEQGPEGAKSEPAPLYDLRERMPDPDYYSLQFTARVIPDRAFRDALLQVYDSEEDYKSRVDLTSDEIIVILQRMSPALTAFHEAAEHYIFSGQ
jgi:hypothetical protein